MLKFKLGQIFIYPFMANFLGNEKSQCYEIKEQTEGYLGLLRLGQDKLD